MWDNSTQTIWQCDDCNFTSDYPMRSCDTCDSIHISEHTTDYSGGESVWKNEDEDSEDDEDGEDTYTEDELGRKWR